MSDNTLLEIRGLKKYFDAGRTGLFSGEPRRVHAVDDVSLTLHRGEVIALVGESGCGKSTLGLLLMGLEDPTAGSVLLENRDITHLNDRQRKSLRRKIQMVFQDPYKSPTRPKPSAKSSPNRWLCMASATRLCAKNAPAKHWRTPG